MAYALFTGLGNDINNVIIACLRMQALNLVEEVEPDFFRTLREILVRQVSVMKYNGEYKQNVINEEDEGVLYSSKVQDCYT